MSRSHDEESELSEARRHTVDDEDASEPASAPIRMNGNRADRKA